MKKFRFEVDVVYNNSYSGFIDIEAENEEEARKIFETKNEDDIEANGNSDESEFPDLNILSVTEL